MTASAQTLEERARRRLRIIEDCTGNLTNDLQTAIVRIKSLEQAKKRLAFVAKVA